MKHHEVRRRMGEYLQGDLTLAQRALIDAHLDGCEACSDELHTLRSTVHLLRDLPTPEVPPHLVDRVIARIEDGEGRSRWWDGPLAFWNAIDPSRYLQPLTAAALTSAVVIYGVTDLGWQIPGLQAPQGSETADFVAERTERAKEPAAAPLPRAPASAPASRAPAPARVERSEVRSLSFGRTLGASAPAEAPTADALEEEVAPVRVYHDPQAFLEAFRRVQAERQEAWLRQMADEAARRREVDEVTRRLREDAGPEGRELARRWEAVAYPAGR